MELPHITNVELIEDKEKDIHKYIRLRDGAQLIGVTTLMKKMGLSPNYSGIDPVTLKYAAFRGTFMHELFEDYDNGKNVIIRDIVCDQVRCVGQDADGKDMFEKILGEDGKPATIKLLDKTIVSKLFKSYQSLHLPIAASEYLICDDQEQIASSIDKVCKENEDGTVDIIDMKFTSSVHDTALSAQLSIYAKLFEDITCIKVRNLYCCHGDVKTGKMRLIPVRRLTRHWVDDLFTAYYFDSEYDGVLEYVDEVGEDGSSHEVAIIPQEELPALAENIARLAELKAAIKVVEKAIEPYEDKLYQYMEMVLGKGITEKTFGDIKVKWSRKPSPTTGGYDTNAMVAKYPDIAAQFKKADYIKKGTLSYSINTKDNGEI